MNGTVANFGKQLDSYLKPALWQELDDYIENVRDEMLRMKVFATRNLMQSFVPGIERVKGKYVLRLEMDYYWKYLHYGVNGTQRKTTAFYWRRLGLVPASATWQEFIERLKTWKKFKGIPKDVSPYAIARQIRKKGIEGRPFLDKPTAKFIDAVGLRLRRTVEQIIREQIWR